MKGVPPDHTKFKKGESGNPNGRPKGTKNRSTIARKWLEVEQKLQNPITGENEKMSQEDIMTLALIKKSREGDVAAYRALMDSAYHQSLMLVNDPDNPVDLTTFHFNIKKDAD
jgi:hypothetical protein